MPTVTASSRRTQAPKEPKSAGAAGRSRGHHTRLERESDQRRWLVLGAVGLAALAAVILAIGWYVDTQVRASDTAAVVFGQPITTGEIAEEMRHSARAIDAQARQFASAGGQRAAIAEQVQEQKRLLPEQVLNLLVQQRILEREAARRGIVVTPDEIEARVRENVAEFHALTAPKPEDAEASPAAADVSTSPTAIPPLEPAQFRESYQKQLEQYGLSDDRYRVLVRRDLLREKVEQAITADVAAGQEQVHARHILVADEGMAQEALRRLEGGADFATLASELSTDPGSKDKGGDLGWFPKGIMNEPFQEAAWTLQPGQRSGIVRSPNGFHIIEVLERDANRPVEEPWLNALQAQAFSKWLAEQRASPEVTLEFVPAKRDWTLRQIGVRP